MTQLIFVYNADGGLWNGMTDILHKIFSPATYPCSLCNLTHGVFFISKEWKEFVKKSSIEFVVLHKDEFLKHFPQIGILPLPCILKESNNEIAIFVEKNILDKVKNISMLKQLILDELAKDEKK